MNIGEKRQHNDTVLNLISHLRYEDKPIELVGSASLRNQRYYSDYDFFSLISKTTPYETFTEINRILRIIEANPNYYLIELKFQTTDEKKVKYYPPKEPTLEVVKKLYNKLDFIKIDMCIFDDSRFIEVSVIYKIHDPDKNSFTKDDYIKALKNDIADFKKDNNYYKILKRLYNYYRVNNERNNMVTLTKFFNSDVGKMYQDKSNLDAIKLMQQVYKNDNIVKQKIKVNLSKISPVKMTDYGKLQKTITEKALEFGKENKMF